MERIDRDYKEVVIEHIEDELKKTAHVVSIYEGVSPNQLKVYGFYLVCKLFQRGVIVFKRRDK